MNKNVIPCEQCHESYRRSFSTIASYSDELPSVVWPFFGCVSFDPILGGRCGNCAWSDRPCSWEHPMPTNSSPSDPFPLAGVRPAFDLKAPPVVTSLADWTVRGMIPEDRQQALADQTARVIRKAKAAAAKRR